MPDVIAIDARPLADPGGEAYAYTVNLVHALAFVDPDTQFHLFCDREPAPEAVPAAANVQATRLDAAPQWWKASALPAAAAAVGAGLLHVQGLLPAAPAMPVVTTLRHLDPLLHAARYPRRVAWPWRYVLPRQLPRAAAVIVPFAAVAEQVERQFGLAADRLHVIPYGVEPAFQPQCESVVKYARERLALPERYVLGRVDPRDGPGPLRAVWQAARAGGLQAELVLDQTDGLADPGYSVAGTDPRAWPALLSGAVAVLLGGGRESAALALLEAMACGTPAVGEASPLLGELAGRAGVFGDAPAQIAALIRLEADPDERTVLLRRGLARARRYTWPGMAERTLAVYDLVRGRPARAIAPTASDDADAAPAETH